MFIVPLGLTTLVLAIYGQYCWYGGVIKIDRPTNDNVWYVQVYCGGPDDRAINPAIIRKVKVNATTHDPFTGRLLIDEMQDLLKSQEIVYIRFDRKGPTATALAIEHSVGLRLNLKLPP